MLWVSLSPLLLHHYTFDIGSYIRFGFPLDLGFGFSLDLFGSPGGFLKHTQTPDSPYLYIYIYIHIYI